MKIKFALKSATKSEFDNHVTLCYPYGAAALPKTTEVILIFLANLTKTPVNTGFCHSICQPYVARKAVGTPSPRRPTVKNTDVLENK